MPGQKGCYSLLADDNSRFSNTESLLPNFKAHLVYNLILNGRIVFSDNQVICSSNLQRLAAADATVAALFEEGFFDLAIRAGFDGEGRAPLRAVHEAFVREEKIRYAATAFDDSPALALIDRCARPIPWSYDSVRAHFTESCERLLRREFRPLLADAEFDRFAALLEAEKERDCGLGREFLQNRLHLQMRKAGISVGKARRELIRRCTDAPYLSNLPSSIGLNPIYGDEHRPSFDLLRGGGRALEAVGERKAPSRFDYEHHVAGLCRLTVDDIHFLQELPSRERYLKLSTGGLRSESDFDEAFDAFVEFNLLVEDRIAESFPEIARHSPGDPDRSFLKQKAKSYAAAGAEDIFGILVGLVCPVVPLSICKQLILDMWSPASGGRRSLSEDTVGRQVRQRRLAEHLAGIGEAGALQVEDRPVSGAPFTKEIIVS